MTVDEWYEDLIGIRMAFYCSHKASRTVSQSRVASNVLDSSYERDLNNVKIER